MYIEKPELDNRERAWLAELAARDAVAFESQGRNLDAKGGKPFTEKELKDAKELQQLYEEQNIRGSS